MTNTQLLGNFKSVSNFEGRNGKVKNQFLIETDKGSIFQSYNSVIAAKVLNSKNELIDFRSGNNLLTKTFYQIYLDKTYWNYSVTTSKYRNQFLGETTAETQKKIDSGEYILTDLN